MNKVLFPFEIHNVSAESFAACCLEIWRAFQYPRFTCLREHLFDPFGVCEGILISARSSGCACEITDRREASTSRKKKNEESGARRSRRRGIPNIIIGDACMGHLASSASLLRRGTSIRQSLCRENLNAGRRRRRSIPCLDLIAPIGRKPDSARLFESCISQKRRSLVQKPFRTRIKNFG